MLRPRKLPAGEYIMTVVSVRKVRNKAKFRMNLQVETENGPVSLKETLNAPSA